jgi:O-antigen ligase
MLAPVLILIALPWLLIFLHVLCRRPFTILVIWLLVGPIVMYLVQRSEVNVLYRTEGTEQGVRNSAYYYDNAAQITLQKLINPNRTLLGLLFIAFILNTGLKKTRRVPFDTTEKWMGIFSLVSLANVFLWSARLAYGLHVAVDAFTVPFLAYYFTRRLVTSEERFHQLATAIGYMGVYVIVFCLIERLAIPGLLYRLRGPFESPNTLHVVLAVVFFITLAGGLEHGNRTLPSFLRRFVMCLTPIIIALTLTRGNWVGFLLGLGVFLLMGRRLSIVRHQLGTAGLTLISIVIIALCLLPLVPEELVEGRIGNPSNLQGRFPTWMATILLASEAPVLGVGLNNLSGLLSREVVRFGEFVNYSTPHNSYLSITAELGIVGLIPYIIAIVTIFRTGLRLYRTGPNLHARWRGVTLLAIMVAYLTPSLFANTMYVQGLIHVYVYVLAGAIAGLYGKQRPIFSVYRKHQYQHRPSSHAVVCLQPNHVI